MIAKAVVHAKGFSPRTASTISSGLCHFSRNEFESGDTSCAKRRGIFFGVSLHFLGSTSTVSRFGERFRDGQYSLASFLFAVLCSRFPL